MKNIDNEEMSQLLSEIIQAVQNGIKTGKINVDDMQETNRIIQLATQDYLNKQRNAISQEINEQYQKTVNQNLSNLIKNNANDFDKIKQYNQQLQTENFKIRQQIKKNQKHLRTVQKQVDQAIKDSKETTMAKIIGAVLLSLISLFLLIFIGTMLWNGGIASVWHWLNIHGLSWFSTFKVISGTLLSALIIVVGLYLALLPQIMLSWLTNKVENYKNNH